MSGNDRSATRAIGLLLAVLLAFTFEARAQTPAGNAAGKERLTLDRLYSLPHLIGTKPTGFAWSRDGSSLAFLWNDEGRNFRDVWVVDVDDPGLAPRRVTRMPAPEAEPTDPDDPFAVAEAEERAERNPGVTAVTWHPDGQQVLVTFRGDLWLVSTEEIPQSGTAETGSESDEPILYARPQRLTATKPAESRAVYSPDGGALAFLKSGDVWTIESRARTGTRAAAVATQRTQIVAPDVRVRSFKWSPDGQTFAVLEADESSVPQRSIPDYLTDEPKMVRLRRAYPGDEPVRTRIGLVNAGRVGPTKPFQASVPMPQDAEWIDLAVGDQPAPDMILGYDWSPDGRHIAIDSSDLYAKDRKVWVVDVAGGAASPMPRLVARDLDPENETFYFWRIAWSTDSRLLYFLSDRQSDYHVWAVAPSGAAPRALTSGNWAVAEMHPIEGGLIVVGNRGRAEERQLFLISNRGGEPVRVSDRPGTHSPTVSPSGRHAAVAFSNDATPPELLLTRLDVAAGAPDERQVTRSPIDEFSSYRWVQPAYVTFPSHVDGSTLHGRLTLPPNFDPSRKYPAILGSVYTDSVRNQWGGRTAHPTWGLDQYLAQEGYILLNVDMRGSWGRGREHRRGIRLDYGGMDIEDLESGVRFLGTLGYVDTDRVGIWGSSYGGLMTAMSLFRKPGLYAAGVAGAPATNVWHALTGQMAVMMRPEDQPEEYADSSPYLHGHGLEDPLMIIHGMRDWVVLFKDSVTLVQRLIMLGKDVDLVALPNAGHGWDNEGLAQTRFAFKRLVEHFDRHLKSPE
jgi:dipeptidyl-peptidase-4